MLIPNHRATAVLHPGAVYKGQQLNTQVVRIVTANVDNIESKVREVEQRMGIKSSDMISVTYERQSENTGRGIAMLIGLALVVLAFRGFQAMSKNVRSSMGGAGANPFSSMTKADFFTSPLVNASINKIVYIGFIRLSTKLYIALINIDRNVLNYAFILVRRN